MAAQPLRPILIGIISFSPLTGWGSAAWSQSSTFQTLKLEAELAKVHYQADDIQQFQAIQHNASDAQLHSQTFGTIVQFMAEQLIGTSYAAGTLDQFTTEQLVISLTQFDCFTFVESVLALAHTYAMSPGSGSFQTFTQYVQQLRYRDGSITGYCSRLHYFSDWLDSNQANGILTILSSPLHQPILKSLNYMSRHPHQYWQLQQDPSNLQCIMSQESLRNDWILHYIPTHQVKAAYTTLEPGDIVGVVTQISGLDVTHTGLIRRSSALEIGLIHASPAGQVVVAADLKAYIAQVPSAIGILVARVRDPRLAQTQPPQADTLSLDTGDNDPLP